MIPNEALTNALRSLNFTFQRQADRVMLWRQRGSQLRAAIRRNKEHDPEYARTILRNAGMLHAEIEKFISETNKV